jgi:hypothetical protein
MSLLLLLRDQGTDTYGDTYGTGSSAAGAATGALRITGRVTGVTVPPSGGGATPVPHGYPYLGPAGALLQLPSPEPGYEATDLLRGAVHELLGGGNVRDRIGAVRRRFQLRWPTLSDANWSLIRTLVRMPGPYRYLDPLELNLLTANQSTGTDELRTIEGVVARFQGLCTSDSTQARSGVRSIKWDSQSALSISGRGPYFYTAEPPALPDSTWAAVRPNVAYSFSVWAHASAAVSYQALIDWHTATGTYLSTSTLGASTAVATGAGAWTQLKCENQVSPATAAYGIPAAINSTTPGATRQVWFDDPQFEEGAAATTWRLGAGTPLVSVDSLTHDIPLADGTAGYALHAVELALVEL